MSTAFISAAVDRFVSIISQYFSWWKHNDEKLFNFYARRAQVLKEIADSLESLSVWSTTNNSRMLDAYRGSVLDLLAEVGAQTKSQGGLNFSKRIQDIIDRATNEIKNEMKKVRQMVPEKGNAVHKLYPIMENVVIRAYELNSLARRDTAKIEEEIKRTQNQIPLPLPSVIRAPETNSDDQGGSGPEFES